MDPSKFILVVAVKLFYLVVVVGCNNVASSSGGHFVKEPCILLEV